MEKKGTPIVGKMYADLSSIGKITGSLPEDIRSLEVKYGKTHILLIQGDHNKKNSEYWPRRKGAIVD
ncbi:MAG: hypothetical protein LBB56_02845 [Chitinispirillales bacterium]|jgi:hypothetical protein|nr:hypothetical protein [Chitinispirillales bacterium]